MTIARSDAAGYTRTAIVLHWLTAALVAVAVPLGLYGASVRTATGQAVMEIHKPLGIAILGLAGCRLAWRAWHRPPPLPSAIPALLRKTAGIVQAALYLLLVAMPISGWWMTSAFHKHQINFFGLLWIPYLPVRPGMPAATAAHAIHVFLAWSLVLLVGLHAAAAFKHHFIDKDAVLSRMLGRRM